MSSYSWTQAKKTCPHVGCTVLMGECRNKMKQSQGTQGHGMLLHSGGENYVCLHTPGWNNISLRISQQCIVNPQGSIARVKREEKLWTIDSFYHSRPSWFWKTICFPLMQLNPHPPRASECLIQLFYQV